MRILCITMMLVGALSGCAGRPLDDLDGAWPLTGIYDVTVSSASGDCRPAPVSGPFQVTGVVVEAANGSRLSLDTPDKTPDDVIRTSLDRVDLTNGLATFDFGSCGAKHELQFTLDEHGSNEIIVERSDTWSNVAAADPACNSPPSVSADCTSKVQFRYDLVQECAAPCRFILVSAGPDLPHSICQCSDGGIPSD